MYFHSIYEKVIEICCDQEAHQNIATLTQQPLRFLDCSAQHEGEILDISDVVPSHVVADL